MACTSDLTEGEVHDITNEYLDDSNDSSYPIDGTPRFTSRLTKSKLSRGLKQRSVDPVALTMKELKLPINFKNLLNLYGIRCLDDLSLLDNDLLDRLEEKIHKNSFRGTTDLTRKCDQLKYLGCRVSSIELRNFVFADLDREKLTGEKLQQAIQKVKAEMERKKNLQSNRLIRSEIFSQLTSTPKPQCDISPSQTSNSSSKSNEVFLTPSIKSFGIDKTKATGSGPCLPVNKSAFITPPASPLPSPAASPNVIYTSKLFPGKKRPLKEVSSDIEETQSKIPRMESPTKIQEKPVSPSQSKEEYLNESAINEFGETSQEDNNLSVNPLDQEELDFEEQLKKSLKGKATGNVTLVAADFSRTVRNGINEFWKMTTYDGPLLQLNDIKTALNKQGSWFSICAKCLVCRNFIKVNMIGERTVTIDNYKNHARRQHVDDTRSGTKLHIKAHVMAKQTRKDQPTMFNFFKSVPAENKSVSNEDREIAPIVIPENTFGGSSAEPQDNVIVDLEINSEIPDTSLVSVINIEECQIYTEEGQLISFDTPIDDIIKTVSLCNKKEEPNKAVKPYKIRSSITTYKYRNFKATLEVQCSKSDITAYFDEINKETRIINVLVEENSALRLALENPAILNQKVGDDYFDKLKAYQRKKAIGGKGNKLIRYEKSVINISTYYLLVGGRLVYKALAQKFPIPSYQTILRHMYQKKIALEGSFLFADFIRFNQLSSGVQYVWIAEDDTRLNKGLSYNKIEDTVMGLILPIDPETGVPKPNFFKFSTIAAIKKYIADYKLSTYAKLFTVRPLHASSKPFVLALYGTDGTSNTQLTTRKWDYITREFLKLGIHVMGFSADGAANYVKAMTELSGFKPKDDEQVHEAGDDFPIELKGLLHAPLNLHTPCYISDSVHVAVRFFWKLMQRDLLIGNMRASKTIIGDVFRTVGKATIGIDPSVLTCTKDAMNYLRVEKLCDPEITKFFTKTQHKATKMFLKVGYYLKRAFIDPETEPNDRVKCAWYVVFFLRLWRLSTSLNKEATLENDFVTSSVYLCVEINAHNLIKFLIKCREIKMPELFLVNIASSQECELMFRSFRSMTTTNYTQINFTIFEMLFKMRRMMKIAEISCVEMKKENLTAAFVPQSLPTNSEMKILVDEGYEEALNDLKELDIFWEEFAVGKKFPPFQANISRNLGPNYLTPDANDENPQVTNQPMNAFGDSETAQINNHDIYLSDTLRCNFEDDLSRPPAPSGFINIKDEKTPFTRKSLVIWSLFNHREKLSNDRLRRFIGEKSIVCNYHENIFSGTYVRMVIEGTPELVYVLSFKRFNGKKNIPMLCDHHLLRGDDGELFKDVSVNVNLFKIDQDTNELRFVKAIVKPVALTHFVDHVSVEELYRMENKSCS